MVTRANPFYRYNNPALGAAFSGVAGALFPGPDKAAAEVAAREAQAAANMALAGERQEDTRGKRIKNDRFDQMPTGLAEAILSGFQFQEEPMRVNPDYQAPAPIDWSNTNLLADGLPQQDIQPMMLEGRSRADQLATALQQAQAYGFDLEDMLKSAGMMQYMNNAMGADPQAGLPFAPFVGVNPSAGTALSPTAQNQISARDAQEALTQATAVEGMRNENRVEIEGMREEGRNTRGERTGRPGSTTVPAVTPSTAKNMREALVQRVNQIGYDDVEPQAIDSLLSLATRLYQDPQSEGFKNTAVSVQEAVDMLEMGQVPDLAEVLDKGFFSTSRRLTRQPGANAPAPAAPAPAARSTPPDIAKVPNVPRGSRVGQQTAQGWEVMDSSGKLIGYIQE
jgi:hypothetical protein